MVEMDLGRRLIHQSAELQFHPELGLCRELVRSWILFQMTTIGRHQFSDEFQLPFVSPAVRTHPQMYANAHPPFERHPAVQGFRDKTADVPAGEHPVLHFSHSLFAEEDFNNPEYILS